MGNREKRLEAFAEWMKLQFDPKTSVLLKSSPNDWEWIVQGQADEALYDEDDEGWEDCQCDGEDIPF